MTPIAAYLVGVLLGFLFGAGIVIGYDNDPNAQAWLAATLRSLRRTTGSALCILGGARSLFERRH